MNTYLPAYKDGRDNVPKRRNIKFRRWGITQKKAYNIQNTAKVWNQKCLAVFIIQVKEGNLRYQLNWQNFCH